MTKGEREYAVRKAHEVFDRWNDVTGYIPKLGGYYYEALGVIEDAVDIGAMVALGLPIEFDDDERLRLHKMEDSPC
jgi:hypothetical protein